MDFIERSSMDRGESQRLAARIARLWTENRHLIEKLAAIEDSTAWALACRLSHLRHRLLPDGSRRQQWFRLWVRGLRFWRREGVAALLTRTTNKLLRRAPTERSEEGASASESSMLPPPVSSTVASERKERVAFLGSGVACEAQSMRYRAHNIIEALALVDTEGTFFTVEDVQANLAAILSHDLIVLVRLRYNHITAMVIDSARRRGLPIIYDIDDYLFDPWVLPYIEACRGQYQADSLRMLDEFAACLYACDYFTGSNAYLIDRAAAFGKMGFLIPNGLNHEQLRLSHALLMQRTNRQREGVTRIGYLSGTRTHQADFRVVYPALMALLRDRADVRLVIVGNLEVGEFPGLLPFLDQIDLLPLRPWTELPAAIATLDINLICLEPTPFNEGKSNLKYFEAGLLKVPSIASPTRIHRESITHGHNGLLARTTEEWYDGLKELIARPDTRELMGQNAYEHVMRNYTPAAVGSEALTAYEQILRIHRSQHVAA